MICGIKSWILSDAVEEDRDQRRAIPAVVGHWGQQVLRLAPALRPQPSDFHAHFRSMRFASTEQEFAPPDPTRVEVAQLSRRPPHGRKDPGHVKPTGPARKRAQQKSESKLHSPHSPQKHSKIGGSRAESGKQAPPAAPKSSLSHSSFAICLMPNTSRAKSNCPFAESGTRLVLWALHLLLRCVC
jgi:hypothetical protein